MQKPLILVTNDDGITAPGIRNLVNFMNEIGDVVVVAPDSPQSGKGHAITINQTLTFEEISLDGPQKDYSLSGTPVDCVKFALDKILPRKPDLVVSGINHGSNASINTIYSGTMAVNHTKKQVDKIRSKGIRVLSYFIESNNSYSMLMTGQTPEEYKNTLRQQFQTMYGKDAQFINVGDVVMIAKTINKLFIS